MGVILTYSSVVGLIQTKGYVLTDIKLSILTSIGLRTPTNHLFYQLKQ